MTMEATTKMLAKIVGYRGQALKQNSWETTIMLYSPSLDPNQQMWQEIIQTSIKERNGILRS